MWFVFENSAQTMKNTQITHIKPTKRWTELFCRLLVATIWQILPNEYFFEDL